MRFDLDTVKNYLKVDYEDDDLLLKGYMKAVENYIFVLTGKVLEDSDIFWDLKFNKQKPIPFKEHLVELAIIYMLAVVKELYENRGLNTINVKSAEEKTRKMMSSILIMLKYGE